MRLLLLQNAAGRRAGRLRALVNKAFTPRVVSELRPRVQAIADELLDAAAKRGELTAGPELLPCDIAAAIAWGFCRFVIPEFAPEERWPALASQARQCEALDVFKAWPIDRE